MNQIRCVCKRTKKPQGKLFEFKCKEKKLSPLKEQAGRQLEKNPPNSLKTQQKIMPALQRDASLCFTLPLSASL